MYGGSETSRNQSSVHAETGWSREQSQRFHRLRKAEPIHYTNLGELKDIICRNDNFNRIFKRYFNSTAGISTRIEHVGIFCNPSAHNRPIFGESEYQAIVVTGLAVFEAMEVSPPALFPTRDGDDAQVSDDLREPENISTDDFTPKPKCHDNIPRPDYSDFFGREEERREILTHIDHPRAWITVIDGIGGVGKTALALNCAEHIRDLSLAGDSGFEYVVWASAKTEKLSSAGISQLRPNFTDLSSLFRTILDVTGFPDHPADGELELVNEILQISPTLLVLDNLETVSDPDVYDFLQNVPQPTKVLATTRERIEGSHRNLRLTALPIQDALAMIRQLATELDATEIRSASDSTLQSLINRVGGIPLAIRLAVGRIATGMPLASYLDKLDSGEAQHDLLGFCFAESWNDLDTDSKSTLIAVTLFSGEPSEAELRHVIGIAEARLNDAVGNLIRRAFLNRVYDRQRETNRYSLLPLTSDFVQQESEKAPDLRAKLQDNYNAYLLDLGRHEEALAQITHLQTGSESMSDEEKLSNMLVESAWRAYQNGNYQDAIGRLENAMSYRDTAYLNHTWGVVEREEGRYGTAREKFRRSVNIDGTRLPTLRSWGRMEYRLDNWLNAVNCFSTATELPGSDPQDFHVLGVSFSRLARENSGSRRYELLAQAKYALNSGFYAFPFGYRETHHNVVNHHALALTLEGLGRIEEALTQCLGGLRLEPHNDRLDALEFRLQRTIDSNT